MGKQPWVQPQLIVLVRGKPQESALSACKDSIGGGGGPGVYGPNEFDVGGGCWAGGGSNEPCFDISSS